MGLLERVIHAIRLEFEDPAESVPYESREGGYLIDCQTTLDVLEGMGITEDEGLLDDLTTAIGIDRQWVSIDWAQPDSPLAVGWENFKRHVETQRRYTFLQQRATGLTGGPDIAIRDVPGALCDLVKRHELFSTLPVGTKWWRARDNEPATPYTTAKELGPAPAQFAKDNRMTPKGIGVFNASDTLDGAVAEVASYVGATRHLSLGEFEQLTSLRVVNLRELPPVPSAFDLHTTARALSETRFLHAFVSDLTQPTKPGDDQKLEYIASQIIAEFFRYTFAVDGIVWTSVADRQSTVCALFVSNEQTIDADTKREPSNCMAVLRLVPDSPCVREPRVTWVATERL